MTEKACCMRDISYHMEADKGTDFSKADRALVRVTKNASKSM